MSNILQDINKFKVFRYHTDFTTDMKYNSKRDELYDDLIEESYAFYICRELIDQKYILDMFDHKKIRGIILLNKKTECIVGFMLFTIHKEYISLKLLGSIEDEDERMGIKIGSLLMNLLEKYAIEKKIYKIKSDVVEEAIEFYKKCGYKINEKRTNMYYIEKNLQEERDFIKNLFNNLQDENYDTDSEPEEIEKNIEKDSSSDMETEYDENEDNLKEDEIEEEIEKYYTRCVIM